MKWVLLGLGLIVVVALVFVAVQIRGFNKQNFIADKSAPDYQSRIVPLWPDGAIPGYRDDQYRDVKLPWYFSYWQKDNFDLKPYMLDYSLAGDGGAARPAILLLPGGGYYFRAEKHEGTKIARWLNDQGIAAFVVNYRLAPYTHPVPLQDATQALRQVRANAGKYNIDPNRIGVMGFSAGGHLGALLSNNEQAQDRPDFSILGYGAVAIGARPLTPTGDLSGKAPSPHEMVTGDHPPTFLWHTKADTIVPFKHSVVYHDILQANDVSSELHLFETGRHGLGMAEDHEEAKVWPGLLLQWLQKTGITS